MRVPIVKENGLVLLSTDLLLEITRRKLCALSVFLLSTAVVKSHQRVTFILLSDVHLGKSRFMLLQSREAPDPERCTKGNAGVSSWAPSIPTAFQWMSWPVTDKARRSRRCWGSAFDALLSMNVLSERPGWSKRLAEPRHCSGRTPEKRSPPQK